jgi:hypothetical protein
MILLGFIPALRRIALNGSCMASRTILTPVRSSRDIDLVSIFNKCDALNNADHAHVTTQSSIADFVAFIASSTLYFISVCSVSEFVITLMFAIFPVNLQILSLIFSILNMSFSFSNSALASSILSEMSQSAHIITE